MTYKTVTITKTDHGRYQVHGTLGTYVQTDYVPTFRTLKDARAYIDRMEKSKEASQGGAQ